MREFGSRERSTRARLHRALHQLQSVRMRVAISAALVASLALLGGLVWLRSTVYEQHMQSQEELAAGCANTLRLRLLRLRDGSGSVEYYVQPLMRCQRIRGFGGDFDWISIPFEIVDSDGRRLDSDSCLRLAGKAANQGSSGRLPSAVLPAPSVPAGGGAAAKAEVVRLPRSVVDDGGCFPRRRYQAYTQTVILTEASLNTAEIVEAESLASWPPRGAQDSPGGSSLMYQPHDLGQYFASWRPGAPAYAIKVYVLVSPREAEEAVAAINLLLEPGLPITVLVIAAVAWSAADQALRIVDRMRAQVATISATGLDQRLAVPDSNDQISRLATTFNDTLDRIERSMHRQRQFIADAAHELRNPIGSIRAMLELARDCPDRIDSADVIAEAAYETRRLQRLAEDLLLLARLESRPAVTLRPVDLAALASAQVADRGRTGKVRVTFREPAADGVRSWPILGSQLELDRLLSNLLDNAERHATTHVVVTIESDPNDSRFLLLTVDDDGPGIPLPDREQIFDRFTRLDEARARQQGGAGLGLAIARGICHGHGGSLTATGNPTGGARFVARFPRAD